MTFQGDPRLAVAHWADEATKAAATAAAEARAHSSEDAVAARARARSRRAMPVSWLARLARRIGFRRR